MTEAEWLAATDPSSAIWAVRECVSDRKLILYSLSCCDRIAEHITDPRSRAAISFAERYAEVGLARRRGIVRVRVSAYDAQREAHARHVAEDDMVRRASALAMSEAAKAAMYLLEPVARLGAEAVGRLASYVAAWQWLIRHRPPRRLDLFDASAAIPEQQEQLKLLRDIFGNPFRPVTVDPAWLTSTVTALARQMYESRDFTPMPILTDALQDAGCDHADILGHCRSDGPHVRGCWVVDLVLGKEEPVLTPTGSP
jgi:hypothetical protein